MSNNQFKRRKIKLSTANNAETKLLVEIVASYFRDFDVIMETKLNHVEFLLFGEKFEVDRVAEKIRKLAAMIGQFVTASLEGERLVSSELLPQIIKGAIDLKFLRSILTLFSYTACIENNLLKTNAPVSVIIDLAQKAFFLLQRTSSTQNLDLRKFNVLMQLKFTATENDIYTWGQMQQLLGYKFAKYYFMKEQSIVLQQYLDNFVILDIAPSAPLIPSVFKGGNIVLSESAAQLFEDSEENSK